MHASSFEGIACLKLCFFFVVVADDLALPPSITRLATLSIEPCDDAFVQTNVHCMFDVYDVFAFSLCLYTRVQAYLYVSAIYMHCQHYYSEWVLCRTNVGAAVSSLIVPRPHYKQFHDLFFFCSRICPFTYYPYY